MSKHDKQTIAYLQDRLDRANRHYNTLNDVLKEKTEKLHDAEEELRLLRSKLDHCTRENWILKSLLKKEPDTAVIKYKGELYLITETELRTEFGNPDILTIVSNKTAQPEPPHLTEENVLEQA